MDQDNFSKYDRLSILWDQDRKKHFVVLLFRDYRVEVVREGYRVGRRSLLRVLSEGKKMSEGHGSRRSEFG